MTNTPGKWINLDVLPTSGLCGSFPGWISTVMKVFMVVFPFWRTKCTKNHISGHIYPSRQQTHPRNGSILMYFPRVVFVDHSLGEFWQLLRFLQGFSILGIFEARNGLPKIKKSSGTPHHHNYRSYMVHIYHICNNCTIPGLFGVIPPLSCMFLNWPGQVRVSKLYPNYPDKCHQKLPNTYPTPKYHRLSDRAPPYWYWWGPLCFFSNRGAQRGILEQNVFASKLSSKGPIKQCLTLTQTTEMIK